MKVSISKYLQAPYNGDVYTINNPAVTLVQTTSRVWTDANSNRDRRVRFPEPRRQRRMPGLDQSELGPAGADDAGQS